VVRLRILNAEIERGYNLGFSDNRTFYIIANDDGLLDAPVPVTRVKLVVGERIEILVDLTKDAQGSSLDLKAFNSNQGFGFGGSEPATQGQFGSLLNNKDFNLLHINVGASNTAAITAIPTSLVKNTYWTAADATNSRTITVTGGQPNGPAFTFDNKAYDHLVFNQTIKLNAIEKWTIVNNNVFGHSFHIHDVQFKILSRSSGTVGAHESGWKDTVYLPVGESVTVIAKYEDFSSSKNAFMYHCHFSNHEDGGMMGQFLVVP
jgi:bilirubin oxidase